MIGVWSAPHATRGSELTRFPLADIESLSTELHAGMTLYIPPIKARPLADPDLASMVHSAEHLKTITE
jgi:hypothetical protein